MWHLDFNFIKNYFMEALLFVTVLFAAAILGYFLIYRKLLKGKKPLKPGRFLIWFALAGYLFMVVGVTVFSRTNHSGAVDFHLFSSYREAWNNFSYYSFRMPVLNVLMFCPLGVLLPLWNKVFRKAWAMLLAGFGFSLTIETVQLIGHLGIFELDDLFNNTLGAMIGYGLIMTVLTLTSPVKVVIYSADGPTRRFRDAPAKKIILYLLPLIIFAGALAGACLKHSLQELGNHKMGYTYRMDMSGVTFSSDIDFSQLSVSEEFAQNPMIYKAPSILRQETRAFAENLLADFGADTSVIDVTSYEDNAIYHTADSYHLWLYFNDGTYRFTNFNLFSDNPLDSLLSREEVVQILELHRVYVPAEADFRANERDYTFQCRTVESGGTLVKGNLSVSFNDEGEISELRNNICRYEPYREAELKTPEEAFTELKTGRSRIYLPQDAKVNNLKVTDLSIEYYLDTKQFLQPYYCFYLTGNDDWSTESIIPAIKK